MFFSPIKSIIGKIAEALMQLIMAVLIGFYIKNTQLLFGKNESFHRNNVWFRTQILGNQIKTSYKDFLY